MASDFDYTGDENQQAGFREKSTGMQHWVPNFEAGPVELLDGEQLFAEPKCRSASGPACRSGVLMHVQGRNSAGSATTTLGGMSPPIRVTTICCSSLKPSV